MTTEEEIIGEPTLKKHPRVRRLMGLLLTGLAAVVPIVGTIWLLVLILSLIHI